MIERMERTTCNVTYALTDVPIDRAKIMLCYVMLLCYRDRLYKR